LTKIGYDQFVLCEYLVTSMWIVYNSHIVTKMVLFKTARSFFVCS